MQYLKYIIEGIKLIKAFAQWVSAFILKKKQDGQEGKIQAGENKISEAQKIADAQERLKKKAEGAHGIENGIAGK
jgi:hypothetical protein